MSKVVVLYDDQPSDRARENARKEAPHRGKANLAEGQRLSHTGMLASISTTSCRLESSGAVSARSHVGSCAREDQGHVAMGVAGSLLNLNAGAPLLVAAATQKMSDRRTGEFGVSKIIRGLRTLANSEWNFAEEYLCAL